MEIFVPEIFNLIWVVCRPCFDDTCGLLSETLKCRIFWHVNHLVDHCVNIKVGFVRVDSDCDDSEEYFVDSLDIGHKRDVFFLLLIVDLICNEGLKLGCVFCGAVLQACLGRIFLSRLKITEEIQEIFITRVVIKIEQLLVKFKFIFWLMVHTVATLIFEVVTIVVLTLHHLIKLVLNRNIHDVITDTFTRFFGVTESFKVQYDSDLLQWNLFDELNRWVFGGREIEIDEVF